MPLSLEAAAWWLSQSNAQRRAMKGEPNVEVNDIKTVLLLAKAEHDDNREDVAPADHEAMGKSIEAVEVWLHEIGALPPR